MHESKSEATYVILGSMGIKITQGFFRHVPFRFGGVWGQSVWDIFWLIAVYMCEIRSIQAITTHVKL